MPISIKHGVFGGKLAFTGTITPSDVVTLIGVDVQSPRTMADLDQEVFTADDDGLGVQRELLVIYRVAAAAVATTGRDGRYQARDIMYEVERMERDLAATEGTIRRDESQIVPGFGPRSDYV